MDTLRSAQPDRVFRFGPFELFEREAKLHKNGVPVKLQEQPFRVLAELAANAGRIVTREELQQKLWPADTFVDFDVGLNSVIRKLRQALNDDADHPQYIETLAKRGYRFLAEVSLSQTTEPAAQAAALPATVSPAATGSPADEVPTARPASNEPTTWRSRLRPWQLAAAGIVLLALGVGIAWWLHPAAPRGVTAVRITANPADTPVTGAVITPDGKYVAYSDPTGVYIRHIDSGEARLLTLPKGFDGIPTSWFPDSTHLLLANHDGPQHIAKIWKASIMGGDPQLLLEDAEQGTVSPDGSQMMFFRGDAFARELWLADADGRSPHRLIAHERQSGRITTVTSAAWSPDGRRIAYVERQSNATGDQHFLYTRKPDGSDQKVVVHDDSLGSVLVGNVRVLPPPLCWALDGHLYFAPQSQSQARSQDHSIWSIALDQESGKLLGQPQELLKSLGWIGGLSTSQSGKRLVFWRGDLSRQTFISEFDRNTRKMSSPRRLTLDQSVSNMPFDWTADSKAVVFASERNGKDGVYKQRLDETRSEVLIENREPAATLPRLSGDGSEILYTESERPNDPDASIRLLAVPLTGGTPRLVLSEPHLTNLLCAKPPSRVCILNQYTQQSNDFFVLDLNHGKARLVTKLPSYANWGLSPDGSTLVLVINAEKGQVRFLSIDSGTSKDMTVKGGPILRSADWSADSKMVLSVSVSPNGMPVILGIDMESNAKVLLEGDRNTAFSWVIPSPDGKYGALGVDTGESNVWMVENY